MFAQKLSAEQRLQKNVSKIMGHDRYIALAGVMMVGERGIKDDVPTACTNGRDEWYGRDFVMGLSDAEFRFIILHEARHKVYRHLTTWAHLFKKNPQAANMACDYVINLQISDENTDGFAAMPRNPDGSVRGCLDNKYRGMSSYQVFQDLVNQQEEEEGQGEGEGDSGGDGGATGFDEHDWEGAKEMTAEEKRDLAQEIDEAIRQGALTAGKAGGGSERLLDDLLQPQVDWREVLRTFVTSTCTGNDYGTWARPNRRYMGAGVYMPSAISEKVDELVIAVDTSGSISNMELSLFLSEVVGICNVVKPDKVRLLYWGSSVVGDEEYDETTRVNLAKSTKPKGGGGTDVNCVVEYMNKKSIKPQAVVVLTDGHLYGGWGTWNVPVLWTVLNNKGALPNCGKAVHITSDQLR